MLIKNKSLYFFFFLFFIISFFININKVLAATINFSPISGTYNVGDTIKIKVIVSSDKSINAVSGKISFSNDLLSLTSLSKSSSIVDLWAQEPSFSNSTGTASFEGVILNGFMGNTGNIITLIFKAKSIGIASLKFSNVSILANDGNGTDIFSGDLFIGSINIEKNNKVDKQEPEAKKIEEIGTVEKITNITKNVVEKIEEVEVSNNLPNNSLLITIIIILGTLLNLSIIYTFLLFIKLKKRFKEKLLRTEVAVDKNFKNLEKEIDSEIIDKSRLKDDKINITQESDVFEEVVNTEGKIIKEIEEIKEEI